MVTFPECGKIPSSKPLSRNLGFLMAELLPEVLEQILIRLDVRDLIRCKSVSKSWLSLISDPLFVEAHLNHSYHNDRNNDKIGHRRLIMYGSPYCVMASQYEFYDNFFDHRRCHLLGSSNGLVCISSSRAEILVVNPSTREVRKLRNPRIPQNEFLCWGFGYDSSTDDYKVILGLREGEDLTCFQVLTLKSNIWKVIGKVNYTSISRNGILCSGALHWVACDPSSQNKKKVVLSFHLSEEKFMEIPQPDDVRFESGVTDHSSMLLGSIEECLCICTCQMDTWNIWIMKEYNVKQSWGIVGNEFNTKRDIVFYLKQLKNYVPNKRSFCHGVWPCRSLEVVTAPIYVKSLVSPHVHRRLKRK